LKEKLDRLKSKGCWSDNQGPYNRNTMSESPRSITGLRKERGSDRRQAGSHKIEAVDKVSAELELLDTPNTVAQIRG
jgi:hypothetical protein